MMRNFGELSDGRYAQSFLYEGNGVATVKAWSKPKTKRDRGEPEWCTVSLSVLPLEFLVQMKLDADMAIAEKMKESELAA
jgi:hypothetical protein